MLKARLASIAFAATVAFGAILVPGSAGAYDIVYSQNFPSGTTISGDAYWTNNAYGNGYVIANTAQYGSIVGNIGADVGGNDFLFDYTLSGQSGNPIATVPIFDSLSFNVAAHTNYSVSYYLTNANNINNADIQLKMNGVIIGTDFTATGVYDTNGWQQYTTTWNSGNSTTGDLKLFDLQTNTYGNDFGIDNIVVSGAVPEPASLILVSIGAVGIVANARRRRQTVSSSE